MTSIVHTKTIKELICQTPLIIDPQREAPRFQDALTVLSNHKLERFYQGLSADERSRFHYTANVCLGYESWCQLYKSLVVTVTQERLADRMEEAFAAKAQELSRRESEMEEERLALGQELMALRSAAASARRSDP